MSMPGPEDGGHCGDSAGQIVRLSGTPVTSLSDVGGLKEELRQLREAVEVPLKHGEALRKAGICPAKLVVVHGPQGSGKTLLLKAFAADAGIKLFTIRWHQLVARSDDDSRRLLADTMARARANMPSLLVLDDLEFAGFGYGPVSELARKKSAQITEAVETVGRDEAIVVIAVTTSPEALDPAMRKPGSLVAEIRLGLPGPADRKSILSIHTRTLSLLGVDLARIAASTDGFSGADLVLLVRHAYLNAVRRVAQTGNITAGSLEKAVLSEDDFKSALWALRQKTLPESRGEVN